MEAVSLVVQGCIGSTLTIYGIMHHTVMASQLMLTWILRMQNHYAMCAEKYSLSLGAC